MIIYIVVIYVCMSPPKSTWLISSHSPMYEPYNHNNIPPPSRGGCSLNCNFSIYCIVGDIPINPIKGCWMPIPTRWRATICHRPSPNQSWRMNVVKFIHLWSLNKLVLIQRKKMYHTHTHTHTHTHVALTLS
jgi:hypothetical protein